MISYPGNLAIQQRVLTPYRAAFFDLLAGSCEGGLSIFAGLPRPEESIATTGTLGVARTHFLHNHHILRGQFYLCYQEGLLKLVAEQAPTALIVEANPRYLATPAVIRWMKKQGHPVIGWGLGAPQSKSRNIFSKWRNWNRGSFLHQFDALITYSRHGADQYAAIGFPPHRIFVASNAATPRPVLPLPIRAKGFKDRPNVLFVGRLQARKHIDTLLHACAALPQSLQPRVVIIGDGPERPNLEALAKTIYPLTDFPGEIHGAELAKYFLAADLFVLPGTGGLAVQEAMSWGLPIIMGQGDGTNDDLVRPGNGWQLSSPSALMDVLRESLTDPSRLREMGAESFRIVAEEINLERMVEVFVGAVNELK